MLVGNTGCAVVCNAVLFLICLAGAVTQGGKEFGLGMLIFGGLALACEVWRRSKLAEARKLLTEAYQAGAKAAKEEALLPESPAPGDGHPPKASPAGKPLAGKPPLEDPGIKQDFITQIERLSALKDRGSITGEEFQVLKGHLLKSGPIGELGWP